jgi:hypothetical protein
VFAHADQPADCLVCGCAQVIPSTYLTADDKVRRAQNNYFQRVKVRITSMMHYSEFFLLYRPFDCVGKGQAKQGAARKGDSCADIPTCMCVCMVGRRRWSTC